MTAITRTTKGGELPDWVRAHEAAAFLDVSVSTVYALLAKKELPCMRVGRLVRIPREALVKRPP